MSQAAQADPFLTDLETLLRPAAPKRCAFGQWLDTLTPERVEAVGKILALPVRAISAERIREFAARHGYALGTTPVQEHRGGRCACVR